MSTTQILRDLHRFFPGATPREYGADMIAFGYTPDNRACGLLNANLAGSCFLWQVAERPDPSKLGFKYQGWGAYVDPTAVYDSASPFPYGLGVFRKTDVGYKTSVLVVADTDPVRLIEPSLPQTIEDLEGWAMGLDDPDEANPDPGLGFLAEHVRSYFGSHGRDWFHVVTSVAVGVDLDRILGCKTQVIASSLQYGQNTVAVVAIETIRTP